MKRTIIYVFGPKRLACLYQNGSEVSASQESADVTNWLKIGLTTTEDDALDKWDAAKSRICQESRTGIPETCIIFDVFEYPYIEKGKPDDEVRRLMTEDVYQFANSKANNGLIENKYEIKAGQEFVYGASRSHVLAAIAKFERDLVIKTYKAKGNLEALIEKIQSNAADVSGEQDEPQNCTAQQDNLVFDLFYEKLIAAMPDYIGEKCNHTPGKNYMTIRTNCIDCKWYYLVFSPKRLTTSVQLETYRGNEAKEKVEEYIENNNIRDRLPQLGVARQGKSDNKYSWDIRGEYKGDENTVINWFVNTTQAMFDAFEPSVQ